MKKLLVIYLTMLSCLFSADISSQEHEFYAGEVHFIVDAEIDDEIDEARVYFKDKRSTRYRVYAKMECTLGLCVTSLPMSKFDMSVLEYVIAYKDMDGNLYRSKKYSSIKRDLLALPKWQREDQDKKIELYSEDIKIARNIQGFSIESKILKSSSANFNWNRTWLW